MKIKVLQTPNNLDPESRKAVCVEYGLEGMFYTMTGEPVSITPDADGHFIIPSTGELHVGGTADLSHTMVRTTYEGDRDDVFEPFEYKMMEFDPYGCTFKDEPSEKEAK